MSTNRSLKRNHLAFPIKCHTCSHLENVATGLFAVEDVISDSNSVHLINAVATTRNAVALDCEMVGVGPKFHSALGRVSIVDWFGTVLYDVMALPEEEITDFRTPWSGIRPTDMQRAIPFSCVQEQVKRIIENKIVVGHMIRNDFSALRISHPQALVRDTARASPAKILAGFPLKSSISLKRLVHSLFGVHIQNGEHCSVEDARATMAVYRLVQEKWEAEINQKKCRRARLIPSAASPIQPSANPVETNPIPFHNGATLPYDVFACANEGPTNIPPSNTLTLTRSCPSLLDDKFWPDSLFVSDSTDI